MTVRVNVINPETKGQFIWWQNFTNEHWDFLTKDGEDLSSDEWSGILDLLLGPFGASDIRDSKTDILFIDEAHYSLFVLRWA